MFFSKKFFPFFQTFFFGAFNDNLLRNALVVLITYDSGFSDTTASGLSFLAMALLMLPFFPFSALAGELADRYRGHVMFRIVKGMELLFMLLTIPTLHYRNMPALMILLFLIGCHSTLFSPLKYSYMPRTLAPGELLKGNAYVNAGTYAAILLGTITGNAITNLPHSYLLTGILLTLLALLGLAGAWLIPAMPAAAPETKVSLNVAKSTYELIRQVFRNRVVGLCTIGISAFWMTGALYVSQLAGFCKHTLAADDALIPIFYAIFSAGVAVGSLLCAQAGKKWNVNKMIAPALLIMALFTLDLYWLSGSWIKPITDPHELAKVGIILAYPPFYRIAADLFLLAVCGGIYSVPLNALIQRQADSACVAQIIAGNNVLNSLAIAIGTISVSLLTLYKLISIPGIFVVVAAVNAVTALLMLPLARQPQNQA